jgi:hypothetical protein
MKLQVTDILFLQVSTRSYHPHSLLRHAGNCSIDVRVRNRNVMCGTSSSASGEYHIDLFCSKCLFLLLEVVFVCDAINSKVGTSVMKEHAGSLFLPVGRQ